MDEILKEISQKLFNRQKYVDLVLSEEHLRDLIVENMIKHPKIMTYYHCFYIVSDASTKQPILFYKYWDKLGQLLEHTNSYHRNFGLILLAKLASVDNKDKMMKIIEKYLELLYDEKFMTIETCVKNCAIIASIKSELQEMIINRLIKLETNNYYSEKQHALMMSYIIEGFELIIDNYPDKSRLLEFAERQLISISPKTRKVAKQFLDTYR